MAVRREIEHIFESMFNDPLCRETNNKVPYEGLRCALTSGRNHRISTLVPQDLGPEMTKRIVDTMASKNWIVSLSPHKDYWLVASGEMKDPDDPDKPSVDVSSKPFFKPKATAASRKRKLVGRQMILPKKAPAITVGGLDSIPLGSPLFDLPSSTTFLPSTPSSSKPARALLPPSSLPVKPGGKAGSAKKGKKKHKH